MFTSAGDPLNRIKNDEIARLKEERDQAVDQVERLCEALAIRHDQYRAIREANIRLGEKNAKLQATIDAINGIATEPYKNINDTSRMRKIRETLSGSDTTESETYGYGS